MEVIQDSISVGYVCGNHLDREFMASVYAFMSYDAQNRRCVLGLGHEPGFFVDDNRNALARKFLKTPAEWLLSLDTDISFEPTVPYLLFDAAKTQGLKIISALYFAFLHDGALRPVWFTPGEHGAVEYFGKIAFGEMYPLAAAGMGCALIHRSAFEAFLKVPKWRNDSWTWFGRDEYGAVGDTAHMGEDICFCQRAHTLGIQTWGHAGVVAKHAKRWEIGLEEFRILYDANYKNVKGEVLR